MQKGIAKRGDKREGANIKFENMEDERLRRIRGQGCMGDEQGLGKGRSDGQMEMDKRERMGHRGEGRTEHRRVGRVWREGESFGC